MRARTVVVFLSWVLLAACRRDPQITSFRVAPQNACPGEVVVATWVTTSDRTRLSDSRAGEDSQAAAPLAKSAVT